MINDPLAVAYYIDRSLCGGFDSYTAVATDGICRGQTVVDSMDFWKKEPNSHVLTETDTERFMRFFFSRVLKKAGRKQMGGRRTDTSELPVEKYLLLKRVYFNGEITMTKRKINTWQICLVALAVGINIVGGQIGAFSETACVSGQYRHNPHRGACGSPGWG